MYDEMTEVRERQRRKQLVRACSRMVAGQIRLGKEASFVNFMFNQLPGGVVQHKEIMTREIRRVHDILSRNVARKPNADNSKHLRPVLIGCHDFPVFKIEKQCKSIFAVNDGMHFNAVVLVPPAISWKWDKGSEKLPRAGWDTSLEEHFKSKARFYLNKHLYRIHVTPIEKGTMAGYTLKAFKSWRVSSDDILVL